MHARTGSWRTANPRVLRCIRVSPADLPEAVHVVHTALSLRGSSSGSVCVLGKTMTSLQCAISILSCCYRRQPAGCSSTPTSMHAWSTFNTTCNRLNHHAIPVAGCLPTQQLNTLRKRVMHMMALCADAAA